MARKGRGDTEEPDLNLAPFMNMVVILIPLLLLSVVFLKIGVINITAPKLSVGPPTEQQKKPDEKPLNLTVAINAKGFRIAATGATLPEMEGCPVPGPTICLEDQSVDVASKFEEARKMFDAGNASKGEQLIAEAIRAYNFRALYNKLAEIKKEYPDETIINLSADADIPYAVVVRAMDVARYKLEKTKYTKASAFWEASYKKTGNKYDELFSDPVLAVVQ